MKKFLILLSSAFILFVGMNKVKAYTTGVDTGSPYFTTNGVVDAEGSGVYDLYGKFVGSPQYGCNNTFNDGYEVEQAVHIGRSPTSGYCNYLLKKGNQYFVTINPMASNNSNEPSYVFMSFTVPTNWNFAVVGGGNNISVLLFKGDFELSYSNYHWYITNTDNTSNMYFKNLRYSSKTPYQPSKYYTSSVLLAPNQYVESADSIYTTFGSLWWNGTTGANSSYSYYSDTAISWNTNEGSQDFPSYGVPEVDYDILEGTERGKKLALHFYNFDENSNATITDMSSGNIITITNLLEHSNYSIDNISYDSVYYIEAYNNDELIYSDTIDVNSEVRLGGKPYIDLVLDYTRLIAWLQFYNLKPEYHVYYSKNNGDFTEVSLEEGNNSIIVGFNNDQPELHNRNYTIRGQITDANNNVLYDRGYNIVFFKDQPYFTFNSSYNNETGCNSLTITFHNSQNNDVISYSYDNTSYTNFDNIKTNKLQVCASSPVYVKATRGNDYYYGYFYVNIEEFESSSNQQYQQNYDLLTAFTNLFGNQDMSFLENFSIFFNALKRSFIYKYLLLVISGAFILLIMKLIRR